MHVLKASQVAAAMQLLLLRTGSGSQHQQQQQQQREQHASGLPVAAGGRASAGYEAGDLLPMLQQLREQLPHPLRSHLMLPGPSLSDASQQQKQQVCKASRVSSPAAACCCAAVWLWNAFLAAQTVSAGKADGKDSTGCGSILEPVWQQQTLPLLLNAMEQYQQQQQHQQQANARVSGSHTAGSAAPAAMQVHPKSPGQRQRYSFAALHALSRSPLIQQLQQNPRYEPHSREQQQQQQGQQRSMQQWLASLDVPCGSSAADAAAVTTSIKSLLSGHKLTWSKKTSKATGQADTSSSAGQGSRQQQQQQHGSYGQRQHYGQYGHGRQYQQHKGRQQQQHMHQVHPYDVPLMGAPTPPPPPPPPQKQSPVLVVGQQQPQQQP
jgi:hypothetical protein